MPKISVIIVDDHKLIREMYKVLFTGHKEIEIIGEAGQFDTAIEMIGTLKPDLVFLDINLSAQSGADAVPLIKMYSPATKILAISMHKEPFYVKKMIQSGCAGYVTKNSPRLELFKAIEEILNDKVYICAEIKDLLSRYLLSGVQNKYDNIKLSLRENEIINNIKQGLTSKEIASKLSISIKTVEAHRYNIYKKLKVKNRTTLMDCLSYRELNLA
ncbi:MAG TPA: response regulator transcription factor [Chitinophagaceae bacterium]